MSRNCCHVGSRAHITAACCECISVITISAGRSSLHRQWGLTRPAQLWHSHCILHNEALRLFIVDILGSRVTHMTQRLLEQSLPFLSVSSGLSVCRLSSRQSTKPRHRNSGETLTYGPTYCWAWSNNQDCLISGWSATSSILYPLTLHINSSNLINPPIIRKN